MMLRTIAFITIFMMLNVACREKEGDVSRLFPVEDAAPSHSRGFTISRASDSAQSVLITTFNPWQGADGVATHLLVLRGGESAPEGYNGQSVEGNPRRIVAMSSSHCAMLEALGETGRIAGVSGRRFIYSPAILAQSPADVGYENAIDYERIVALRPDLVLLYGINGANAMEGKLRELGIPFMYVADYVEQTPMGKAQWLEAIGELCGKRDRARAIVDSIACRYTRLTALAHSAQERPSVMVNTPYGGVWYMPSTTSYLARLIADAGGHYVYCEDTGNASLPVDTEQALALAGGADIWLDTGTSNNIDAIKADFPRFATVPPVENGRVYNSNHRPTPGGGNDLYESGIVHPDIVLADMIRIFHPSLADSLPGDLYYYRQL